MVGVSRVNASLPVVVRLRVTGVVLVLVKVTGLVTGASVGSCGQSKKPKNAEPVARAVPFTAAATSSRPVPT